MEKQGTLIDYISWRGDLSREQIPLNEVDWMIFSRIAYGPFPYLNQEKYVQGCNYVTLGELMEDFLSNEATRSHVDRPQDLDFFELVRDSVRYRDILAGDFCTMTDAQKDLQFSALSIDIPEGPVGVIFRGTDNTVVGWKENLNMTFQCPVEAQMEALRYLNRILQQTDKSIITAGHSKGGNLAVFSSAFCPYQEQDRILEIYNFDGPGFDDIVLVTPQYQNICDRIRTYLPAFSLVGILLGHKEKSEVIVSEGSPIDQHNLFNWQIRRNHFISADATTRGSQFFDETMREWLAGMDRKSREEFVDAAFEILQVMNIEDIRDLKKHWLHHSASLVSVVKKMDSDTKGNLAEGLSIFYSVLKENLKESDLIDLKALSQKLIRKEKEEAAVLEDVANETGQIEM